MNIGILSINLHTKKLNYGAVLHSWFFQKLLLRREDVDNCEVIDYLPHLIEKENALLRPLYGSSLRRPKRLLRDLLGMPAYLTRYWRFSCFIKLNMQVSRRYTQKQLNDTQLPYDTIIFESDVIWSPHYFQGKFDPAFFGALESMKPLRRIAYAASMGNAQLTEAQKSECCGLLRSLHAISVRETYASALIRTLTDAPVFDAVDPVLLAEPADFDGITAKRRVRGDYLLVYFPINPDRFILNCAHDYAKKRGLKVVEISCHPLHALRNKTFAAAGIEEFVSLVRNARVIFSNSLHGTCLALLFHKEFYAFDRNGGEKYRDICRKFALEDRFIEGKRFAEAAPIDWSLVDRARAQYRAKSLEWIDAALAATPEIHSSATGWD